MIGVMMKDFKKCLNLSYRLDGVLNSLVKYCKGWLDTARLPEIGLESEYCKAIKL